MKDSVFQVASFEPLLDQLTSRDGTNGVHEVALTDGVEGALDAGIADPAFGRAATSQAVQIGCASWTPGVARATLPSSRPGWWDLVVT
ncbi:MAG TPA: hypothetical protein VIO57_15385 [Chloroflexota bacterium]